MIDELRCFGAAENPIFETISVYILNKVGQEAIWKEAEKDSKRKVLK